MIFLYFFRKIFLTRSHQNDIGNSCFLCKFINTIFIAFCLNPVNHISVPTTRFEVCFCYCILSNKTTNIKFKISHRGTNKSTSEKYKKNIRYTRFDIVYITLVIDYPLCLFHDYYLVKK